MTQNAENLMLRAARAFTESGLSVVPADVHEKRPRGKWKQYQARIAEPGQLTAWFEKGEASIGVITGRISDNLEVLDHDDKELWGAFCALLESQAPGLLARLPIVQTQSDNHHIFYRCDEVVGNLKLARVPGEGAEWSTSIETRGEGGFVVTAPSSGYRMLQGKLTKIPTITAAERHTIFEAARAFDQIPDEHIAEPADFRTGNNGSRPGDDYNDRADIGPLLMANGWTMAYSQQVNGRQAKYLRRPGKRDGHSATLDFLAGKFYVFSSNAGPFQAETSYSKFAVYALLEHGGNYAEAARALSLQGYGGVLACDASGQQEKATDAEPEVARFYRCTDTGNGQRLADQHRQMVRYSYLWRRWLHWTGKQWKIDEDGEIDKKAKETVASIALETIGMQDAEMQRAVEKWRRASESRTKHNAMLFMAQSEPGISVTPDKLDADLWALNIDNGTINLQTGQLLAHDPARMITKLAPVDYEPQAKCDLWLSFLDRVMAGNQDLIGFLQRAVGYALTGSIREQVIFILYGIGANGKSSFLETIGSLLGDYAARTPTQTLLLKRGNTIPNDIARLKGARFVTITEVEAGRRLAEGLVKQMTGGEKMVARFLNAEFFEFSPEFKLFLATNHKPEIQGTDHAIWRRIRLIPFEVVIPDDEQDKDLPKKLRAELPGILNWALQGCLDWQANGLQPPKAVTDATSRYREDMDILADFLTDRCYDQAGIVTTVSEVFKAYSSWADESKERPLTKKAFGLRLRERGFLVERGTGGTRLWKNIGLLDRPNQTKMGF